MFKGHCFPKAVILQAVYFKLRFSLSYRDIEELLRIRGVVVDHATIHRWVIKLIYPCTSTELPMAPVIKRKPCLHILDTGLINHSLQIMGEMVFNEAVSDAHRGVIAEHIVGQELLASKSSIMNTLNFWTREKAESSAEVDYILPYQGMVIPIEVKAGANGKLRSLLRYLDEAPHNIAIRIYQSEYLVQQATTRVFFM